MLATWIWNGEAMVPMGRHLKDCQDAFKVREYYKMEAQEERSWRSHKHYFAALHKAWVNLPQSGHASHHWATNVETFRKYALIRTGFHHSQTWACDTEDEAKRLAAAIRQVKAEDFALISVQGRNVVRFTARSQSLKEMGKEDFGRSKDAVLGFAADLLGVTLEELKAA